METSLFRSKFHNWPDKSAVQAVKLLEKALSKQARQQQTTILNFKGVQISVHTFIKLKDLFVSRQRILFV